VRYWAAGSRLIAMNDFGILANRTTWLATATMLAVFRATKEANNMERQPSALRLSWMLEVVRFAPSCNLECSGHLFGSGSAVGRSAKEQAKACTACEAYGGHRADAIDSMRFPKCRKHERRQDRPEHAKRGAGEQRQEQQTLLPLKCFPRLQLKWCTAYADDFGQCRGKRLVAIL